MSNENSADCQLEAPLPRLPLHRLRPHDRRGNFKMGSMLSLFADKRKRIKDNRDDKLIKKNCEESLICLQSAMEVP